MASKRMDLNKLCFYVQSGVSNILGKSIALAMCNRFKEGSVIVLIDSNEDNLQEIKKELIESMEQRIQVICIVVREWTNANRNFYRQLLTTVLSNCEKKFFDLAFILHNEGDGVTKLLEPQLPSEWLSYVQESLYAPIALNQEFLNLSQFAATEKLIINISSSVMSAPIRFSNLNGSCKKARDMYFRSLANEENSNHTWVMTYCPGIFDCHQPEYDVNNNLIDLLDLNVDESLLKLPRVHPRESSLKLINILQEMSFINGHDVDFYDTYVL